MPNKYLIYNLYLWLQSETGYYDYDLMEMSDLATYVNIADYHGIALKFPVSDEQYKWTRVSSD